MTILLNNQAAQLAALEASSARIRLDQSELIGARDFIEVGQKLQRHVADLDKRIGRALVDAGKGERFAAPGSVHDVANEMARAIVAARPCLYPKSATIALAASFSLQGEITADEFQEMLERHQTERQINRARSREQPALDPATKTLIVLADGVFYLRGVDASAYHARLGRERALRVELRSFAATMALYDTRGAMLPTDELLQRYATNALHISHDYCASETTFEAETKTLTIGYTLPQIERVPSLHVEGWLQQLAGGNESDLLELYDWIAGTAQRHIGNPAAALALVGPKDTGKSLLATALARLWGETKAVPLQSAVDRFNGVLTRCPIWHADENMPDDLHSGNFRSMVQDRQRDVEHKGQEKVILKGCSRIVITVNEMASLGIDEMNGPDAVDAVADRFAIFDCSGNRPGTIAALAMLRAPGSADVDLDQILRHLAYVQAYFLPKSQRFLGARADKRVAKAAALVSTTGEAPEVFEQLRLYVAAPETFEPNYHEVPSQFTNGRRFPIITQGGALYVYPKELAELAHVPLFRVQRALQAVCPSGPSERAKLLFQYGAFRARYWQLDAAMLLLALGPELAEALSRTLATDTRQRRPAARAS